MNSDDLIIELYKALREITPPVPAKDANCHFGLVPQEKCCYCQRIISAQAVIKRAEAHFGGQA